METFYFGSNDELFGGYWPPDVPGVRQQLVLILNPLGQEYIRSHRLLQSLSQKLSLRGAHVMRFDYRGTGDSANDHVTMTLDSALADTLTAAEEFLEIVGEGELTLLGIRVGANLALRSAGELHAGRVVLWDPIENGREYLAELATMDQQMRRDRHRFLRPRAGKEGELLGFHYGNTLQAQLQQMTLDQDLTQWAKQGGKTLGLVDSSDHQVKLKGSAVTAGLNVSFTINRADELWQHLPSLEMGLNPSPALDQLTTEVVGG